MTVRLVSLPLNSTAVKVNKITNIKFLFDLGAFLKDGALS